MSRTAHSADVGRRSAPLHGRDEEIRTIESFVGGAGGGMSAVVVTGEPGIGKSSVWRRGLLAAQRSGAAVLSITCVEAECEMSHAALEELLSDVFDACGAGLPPPQREVLDAAFRRRQIEVATDRRTVAAAVLGLLRRVLDEGPVVLAIDDLHWADAETRFCPSFAIRRLTARWLTLLLAARTRHPCGTPRRADRSTPSWHPTRCETCTSIPFQNP